MGDVFVKLVVSAPGVALAWAIWAQARSDMAAARAEMTKHIERMDARDAQMLQIITSHTAALIPITGAIEKLASLESLKDLLREDRRPSRG